MGKNSGKTLGADVGVRSSVRPVQVAVATCSVAAVRREVKNGRDDAGRVLPPGLTLRTAGAYGLPGK